MKGNKWWVLLPVGGRKKDAFYGKYMSKLYRLGSPANMVSGFQPGVPLGERQVQGYWELFER